MSLHSCKTVGTADGSILVENHRVQLSSKTSCCACVKCLFCQIETQLNARFVMSFIRTADTKNHPSCFLLF